MLVPEFRKSSNLGFAEPPSCNHPSCVSHFAASVVAREEYDQDMAALKQVQAEDHIHGEYGVSVQGLGPRSGLLRFWLWVL